MYRILVAIDGSECALRAARYAAQRSRESGCTIDVLHVAKHVMAWEVGPLASGDAVESLHVAEASQVLVGCAGAFDASMPVERHVVTGEPARTILEQADRLGANEIVIGSRGLHTARAAVFGSVAYEVLQEARVPVVVVR